MADVASSLNGLLPPEITMWLDLPSAITTIFIVRALSPWINGETAPAWVTRWFGGDRIVGLVLIVGAINGALVEATTASFNLHMAWRRIGFNAGFASFIFKSAKAYFPWLFKESAGTQEAVVERGEEWTDAKKTQDKKDAAP